jgi:hypothetical protein
MYMPFEHFVLKRLKGRLAGSGYKNRLAVEKVVALFLPHSLVKLGLHAFATTFKQHKMPN